ncbi:hypothetical protein ACQ86D_51495 (plasmid) [Streptomyces galilaeus]
MGEESVAEGLLGRAWQLAAECGAVALCEEIRPVTPAPAQASVSA